MAEAVNEGTFVLGTFVGVSQEQYPKLLVSTGGDYQERLEFDQFDRRSGAATLPEGLKEGQRVAIKVWLTARSYVKDGKSKTFVSKKALEVRVVA